ncbi:MAG: ATP-binding protein [Clostridia bacterium]|nr:ATP-binding protein [Clostridia bacterium]
MFKSIQWKLVGVFLLLVLSVILVSGTIMINSVSEFYHRDFVRQISQGLTEDVTKQLRIAARSDTPVEAMMECMSIYSSRFGIDSYRNYYILDENGNYLAGSGDGDGEQIERTENILAAMDGAVGDGVKVEQSVMDYAYPVQGRDQTYLLYLRDTKEEIYEITRSIFLVMLQALLAGALIAVLLALVLSKAITLPLTALTKKVQRMAQGEFDHRSDIAATDELGELTNSFDDMAQTLKSTMEEIAEEKDKMETIIRYMTDGVMFFNRDGQMVLCNPAARRMLGLEEEQTVLFDGFFRSLGVPVRLGQFLYFDSQGIMERIISFGGAYLAVTLAPIKIEEEKNTGVVVVWQDMTERQKLDDLRKEFVANVSHELKTPLTTIKTYSETILDDGLENKEMAISFLGVINKETDRMNRIVSDLLTLSRIDYHKLSWKMDWFSIDELLGELTETLSIPAKKHQHSLTYIAPENMPEIVGDRDRIQQLMINILSNAIKYTPNGGTIRIIAAVRGREVHIQVKDNGIGIPKEDLDRLFERFYRVDKARSRERGGTGLGLSIAKEIADAHGGRISIESQVQVGTTVHIYLPIQQETPTVTVETDQDGFDASELLENLDQW